MTTQPTPGPWRLNGQRVEYGPYVAGDGFCVATIHRDPPEAYDNARLIAAAPELLAALVAVQRYCVTPSGVPDKGKGRTTEQQAALDQARAAIAKATGEQP